MYWLHPSSMTTVQVSKNRGIPAMAGTPLPDSCAATASRKGVNQPLNAGRADVEMRGRTHPSGPWRRHDPAGAQPPDDLGGLDSRFSKAHNSRAVVRRPVSQQLVAFGLRPLRDAVAQILDNRGYFSDPYFKHKIDCSL